MSIDGCLKLVVFQEKLSFKFNEFKKYLFAQTQPLTEMFPMFKSIAQINPLKTGTISLYI